MLPANTTLQKNRFRIIAPLIEVDRGQLYDAYDNDLEHNILLHESASLEPQSFSTRLSALKAQETDGIVGIGGGFAENNYEYLAADASGSRASADDLMSDPKGAFADLLIALCRLIEREGGVDNIVITPHHLRRSGSGTISLVFFGAPSGLKSISSAGLQKPSPYLPLESVWLGIDIVTQNALSRTYDDAAIEVLESPRDERSLLYSLAASIYMIVAGSPPPDALVRSLELMDGNPDPFVPLCAAEPSWSADLSDVISRMAAIRREDRFSSVAQAIEAVRNASAVIAAPAAATVSKVPESPPKTQPVDRANISFADLADEDLDLLEIPVAAVSNSPSMEEVLAADPLFAAAGEQTFVEEPMASADPEPSQPERSSDEAEAAPFETVVTTPEPVAETIVPKEPVDAVWADGEEKPSGKGKALAAAAAAAVLILAGGAWGLLSYSSAGSGVTTEVAMPSQERTDVPPTSGTDPVTSVSYQTADPTTDNSAAADTRPQRKPEVQKNQQRPVVAETKPEKTDKPKPEKTKKLTVDDLLRDN